MLSILINAYACAPNMGSEPGMGWNWVINLAKYCELHVITEGEWEKEILEELSLSLTPYAENIHFYFNPVPIHVRQKCWNQGDWRFYFYYMQWQKKTKAIAIDIIQKHKIDIIHQLNMIGFREPGYLWEIEQIPFVWGPIGGIRYFPLQYLNNVGWKLKVFTKLKNILNKYQISQGKRVKRAIQKSDLLISAIPSAKNAIELYHNRSSYLIPETGCYIQKGSDINTQRFNNIKEFNIIWVGKFDMRKQLNLALKTLAKLNNTCTIKLHVVGEGSVNQTRRFKDMADSLKISDKINWHGNIPHNRVIELMNQSQLFFFTSVSEDTSTVVLEALSCKLPIVCFDCCGFGRIVNEGVGLTIKFSNLEKSVIDFSISINKLINNRNELVKYSNNCSKIETQFSWENKAQEMLGLYKKVMLGDQ